MKMVYLLLSLLFSSVAFAGGSVQGQLVNNLGVTSSTGNPSGSVPYFQDSDGTYPLFTLYAGTVANATANNYYPFYRDGTAYATPSNKKAYCKNFVTAASTSYLQYQLVTSTASITFNQSTALTNPKYQCGADQRFCKLTTNGTANMPSPSPGSFVIGDGATATYVAFQSGSGVQNYGDMEMTCYEK